MIGILRKDFYLVRTQLWIFLGTVFLFTVGMTLSIKTGVTSPSDFQILGDSIAPSQNWFANFCTALVAFMVFLGCEALKGNLLLADQNKRSRHYLMASPLSIKGCVAAKYYECAIVSLFGFLYLTIFELVTVALTRQLADHSLMFTCLVFLGLFLGYKGGRGAKGEGDGVLAHAGHRLRRGAGAAKAGDLLRGGVDGDAGAVHVVARPAHLGADHGLGSDVGVELDVPDAAAARDLETARDGIGVACLVNDRLLEHAFSIPALMLHETIMREFSRPQRARIHAPWQRHGTKGQAGVSLRTKLARYPRPLVSKIAVAICFQRPTMRATTE